MTELNSKQTQEHTDFQFLIQRIYMKDSSFEAPHTPGIFQQEWHPELNLDLSTTHLALNETTYEVVLNLTATVKNQSQIAFLVEVRQAGIFTIQGAQSPQQLEHLLESFCPNILFPYAREAISSEVVRASFPQLVLSPINFDAIYMDKLQSKQQEQVEEIVKQ